MAGYYFCNTVDRNLLDDRHPLFADSLALSLDDPPNIVSLSRLYRDNKRYPDGFSVIVGISRVRNVSQILADLR